MPTLKDIEKNVRAQIHEHRIFWEKVEALRRPAVDFLKRHEAVTNSPEHSKIILNALDQLREAMTPLVGCD